MNEQYEENRIILSHLNLKPDHHTPARCPITCNIYINTKEMSTHAWISSTALPRSLARGIADLCKAPSLHQSVFTVTDTLRPRAAACTLLDPASEREKNHLMQWRRNGSRSARPKCLQGKKTQNIYIQEKNLATFPSIDSLLVFA